MASPRLVIDGNNSRAAIMINSDPGSSAANIADPSFINPLANFGDWKWAGHPDVDYLGIVSAQTISVNFRPGSGGWTGIDYTEDAAGNKYYTSYSRTLYTHGLGYTPILVGTVSINGHVLSTQGDFYMMLTGTAGAIPCRANVYADASKITLFVEMPYFIQSGTGIFAIYICNMGISGSSLVRPPLNSGWSVVGDRLRCGRFDTDYGYFYKNTSGAIPIMRGQSVQIGIGSLPSNSHIHALGWAYNVNGQVITSQASHATTDDTGTDWPGTTTSAATIVKLSAAMPASSPGFQASSGRLRFGNVLDTDRNMFLISNALLNKTATVPDVNASKTSVLDQTYTFNLGSVHPNATDVLGLYTALGRIRSIGGTSIIGKGNFPMRPDRYQIQTGQTQAFAYAAFFYFTVSGNKLNLIVKRKFPLDPNETLIKGFSITVNALVGAFDY